MNLFSISDINKINWTDLENKNLTVKIIKNELGTIVIGVDNQRNFYLLDIYIMPDDLPF